MSNNYPGWSPQMQQPIPTPHARRTLTGWTVTGLVVLAVLVALAAVLAVAWLVGGLLLILAVPLFLAVFSLTLGIGLTVVLR